MTKARLQRRFSAGLLKPGVSARHKQHLSWGFLWLPRGFCLFEMNCSKQQVKGLGLWFCFNFKRWKHYLPGCECPKSLFFTEIRSLVCSKNKVSEIECKAYSCPSALQNCVLMYNLGAQCVRCWWFWARNPFLRFTYSMTVQRMSHQHLKRSCAGPFLRDLHINHFDFCDTHAVWHAVAIAASNAG